VLAGKRSMALNCKLDCYPGAGSTTSSCRRWIEWLSKSIRATPVQLPGGENRTAEQLFTDTQDAVDSVIDGVAGLAGEPLVSFGHSMGALIAFVVARRLENEADGIPSLLVVACAPGPRAPRGCEAISLAKPN
jgi:surfactin synthase thioesterase subunit